MNLHHLTVFTPYTIRGLSIALRVHPEALSSLLYALVTMNANSPFNYV